MNKGYLHYTIRNEKPEDHRTVEELTRDAFWNIHVPGCDEHFMLHNLRMCAAFIPELDLVAELDGRIVGHIVYTRAAVINDAGTKFEVLCFGPVSVHPEFQRQGIGSTLIRKSLDKAKEMGFAAVCIYGDPRYYVRFGFRSGERYGIKTSDGMYAAALLVLALRDGALSGISGRFEEDVAFFEADKAAFEAFDAAFPRKKKARTASQTVFEIISGIRYPD